VQLSRSPCHYGGERVWFLCPDCDKRVAVLALHGSRFVCRHCHKRPYGSQQEGYVDRMQRKARKVRKRLGATDNLMESIWRKPKGMHQKTFDRLRREEQAANHAATMVLDKQMAMYERLLCYR
jgi:ribosomal protein S27AE